MDTAKMIAQYLDYVKTGLIEDRYEWSLEDFAQSLSEWPKEELIYLQVLVKADQLRPNITSEDLTYAVEKTLRTDETGDACPFIFMSEIVQYLDPHLEPDADTMKLAFLIWANGPEVWPQ